MELLGLWQSWQYLFLTNAAVRYIYCFIYYFIEIELIIALIHKILMTNFKQKVMRQLLKEMAIYPAMIVANDRSDTWRQAFNIKTNLSTVVTFGKLYLDKSKLELYLRKTVDRCKQEYKQGQ